MNCCKPPGNRFIPWFGAWQEFSPVIPKMYWDVESQEQRLHAICKQLHKLCCFADFLGDKISINRADIDELQMLFEKFMESGFDDYYADQVEQWIDAHLQFIFEHVVKQVYFGLTLDGHFVAYVPDSWSDITFDTGMVYGRSDYGRLILKFSTSGEGAIDNTYSYSLSEPPSGYESLIADLETNARRTDACYDTLFTNLDEDVVINGYL